MLGAIIGDIAGSRFEFGGVPEDGFELFTDECSYTDDTICTIAIADAILNGRPYKDCLLDWCHRYPEPMGGYGSMFQHWLLSKNPQPSSSYGNGSAMRVSPVGWLFDDYHEVLREAEQSAIVSHAHREGIKGAQCVAVAIYWLRTVRMTKDEIEGAVHRNFGYTLPPLKNIYKLGSEDHFDATCQETVPAALRCFIESQNYEDAVRIAIMARGDTDTKAAITGSIAEAFYEIPEDLIERAFEYLPENMLAVIEQFYDHIQAKIKDY